MAIQTPTAAEPKAAVFSLKTPLLSEGRSDAVVARSDVMTARIKVYAQGGENSKHTHTTEDHVFLVLAGQATFRLGKEEREQVVNPNEGVLLPKGAYYWFESSGNENLVMYRVGAGTRHAGDRIDGEGQSLPADSEKNKHTPGVTVPGKFFGA